MITVYTDGACRPNPGKGGIGVVFEGDRMSYSISEKCEGERLSNNQVEYIAVYRALQEILSNGFHEDTILINSDAQLIVEQLSGRQQVAKGGAYVNVYLEVKKLLKHFPNIKLQHVPREENTEANMLASRAVKNR